MQDESHPATVLVPNDRGLAFAIRTGQEQRLEVARQYLDDVSVQWDAAAAGKGRPAPGDAKIDNRN